MACPSQGVTAESICRLLHRWVASKNNKRLLPQCMLQLGKVLFVQQFMLRSSVHVAIHTYALSIVLLSGISQLSQTYETMRNDDHASIKKTCILITCTTHYIEVTQYEGEGNGCLMCIGWLHKKTDLLKIQGSRHNAGNDTKFSPKKIINLSGNCC